MSLHDVAVLGVGMVRFGAYKGGKTLTELARSAGFGALEDAGVNLGDVGEAYVGYMQAPIMSAVKIMKEFGLTGLPVTHVENASATGSVTFRDAAWSVASGRSRIAMALGFEAMTLMAARTQSAGRGIGRDTIDSVILPAAFFALWAMRRMHERGTKPKHFAQIAAKNWNYGAKNPFAHRQSDHVVTPEEVLAAQMVSDPLTTMMACPIDDGAACAILGTVEEAKRLHPDRPVIRVRAAALQSERYTPGHTFLGPVVGPASMTHTTAQEAYEAAGLGPEDMDLAFCHDAFANEELEYYELLGFCAEGEGEKLIEEGQTGPGGRIPFNTDGGLIARGHPGGPTGLAQIHELVLQLRGRAGARQVEGARAGLAHLVGGGSVCAINILQRDS